nr:MAG TPA: hypothetical protein [Caudoviricetes sp.]
MRSTTQPLLRLTYINSSEQDSIIITTRLSYPL